MNIFKTGILVLALNCLVFTPWPGQADTLNGYVKKTTWLETMIAAREKLTEQELAVFAPYHDDNRLPLLLRGIPAGQKTSRTIDVSGMQSIFIGAKNNATLHAPILIDRSGKKVPLKFGKPFINKKVRIKANWKNREYYLRDEYEIQLNGQYTQLVLECSAIDNLWVSETSLKKASRTFADQCKQDRKNILLQLQEDFPAEADAIAEQADVFAPDWKPGQALEHLKEHYIQTAPAPFQKTLTLNAEQVHTLEDLPSLQSLYLLVADSHLTLNRIRDFNSPALKRAVADLAETYPQQYDRDRLNAEIDEKAAQLARIKTRIETGDVNAYLQALTLLDWKRELLLSNPAIDFDSIVLRRIRYADDRTACAASSTALGTPGLNSHTNMDIRKRGWNNQLILLNNFKKQPTAHVLHTPDNGAVFRDLDLGFDADHILFSSINDADRWALFEIGLDGNGLKELTPREQSVDYFDACYLPDGKIITGSTAGIQGLPCEGGKKPMVNLYRLDPQTQAIRQLTFEQDSDWHPAVTKDGRVLYLRWEYTDEMHYFTRILMHMNPDGTNQSEYYGSGSFFPTAFKHARQIPDSQKVVGIIGGHHAEPESGRMAIIDPYLSRQYPFRHRPETKDWGKGQINIQTEVYPKEKTGFVAEIGHWGKDVIGNVVDNQGGFQFQKGEPRYVYPYPINDKYFLTTLRRDGQSRWGIYLVDIYDNITLIKEDVACALTEPIPLKKTKRPPAISDRTIPGAKTANCFITDVYEGVGLKGIPRGTVKKLRIFSYHYAYWNSGGHNSVGTESSWDIKRILGEVPVEDDGSASFVIPANTPVALQPLDENGAALQLMRTWFVGMPGENVSCVGCHESQNEVSPSRLTKAARRAPSQIEPWYGPARPFAFETEVQPVLEKHCVSCHNGSKPGRPDYTKRNQHAKGSGAYADLHPYVRRPGPESDMHFFNPMEYHVSTSNLIQMLNKGHHGVKLDQESREKLYAWIDLNAPYRGKWEPQESSHVGRRLELQQKYAGIHTDPENEYEAWLKQSAAKTIKPIKPAPLKRPAPDHLECAEFPFDRTTARKHQGNTRPPSLKLGNGIEMDFVTIPAGQFIMGSQSGYADEQPRAKVNIDAAFAMGVTEVTNEQYEQFDPTHDTRYIDEHGKDHALPGYIANHPKQPVSRVSWQEAMAFCKWLSERSDKKVTLPTEAQWEWAARAGTESQFFYGDKDSDFSTFANLADADRRNLNVRWQGGSTIHDRIPYPANSRYPLRDDRFKDNWFIVDYVGQVQPNAWGLKDMIGNVWEWTRSDYQPYPYIEAHNSESIDLKKTVRGGSWEDRPIDAGASIRTAYESYQKVFDVGFRVIIENPEVPENR